MFKNLFLPFFFLFFAFITIYPSKKENTNLFNYCYSLEKILSRHSLEKGKKLSDNVKTFAKDITLFGTSKTQGALANNIIDQYKISKKMFVINFLPNKVYCLTGYWIEKINPGTFITIFYEKSKQKIYEYRDLKREVDELIKDINSEYKSLQNEIKDLF